MGSSKTDRWNHNIHYGRQLLQLVPDGARDALDVGCGEGWLVRELHQRVPHVVGIDPDAFSITTARASGEDDGIEYVQGDLLNSPFTAGSFDMVTVVASLHHFDEEAGLRLMAELLRPGGLLGVVGLARTRLARDLAFDIAGVFATRAYTWSKSHWETPAPKMWPAPHSYSELRRLTATLLPGREFKRRAMWRYTLTWTKPQGRVP